MNKTTIKEYNLLDIIEINCKSNPILKSFLNNKMSLEEALPLYGHFIENCLTPGIEVGLHSVTKREMIYLFKSGKLVYEDNREEEVPFVKLDNINRFVRVISKENSIITERFLTETREIFNRDSSNLLNYLSDIKQSFLNCKIKVIDDVVYLTEPLVYVFVNLIRSKAKKFNINIKSSSYNKDSMKVFFSIYRNIGSIFKDELFASLSLSMIMVKRNNSYNNHSRFLYKRCELIQY